LQIFSDFLFDIFNHLLFWWFKHRIQRFCDTEIVKKVRAEVGIVLSSDALLSIAVLRNMYPAFTAASIYKYFAVEEVSYWWMSN
jgi:hypothetical protein